MESYIQPFIVYFQKTVIECEEHLLGLSLLIEAYLFVFYLILFMGKIIPNPIARKICFNIIQKSVGFKFLVFQLVCAIAYLGLLKTIQRSPRAAASKGSSLVYSLGLIQVYPILVILRNRENLNGIFGIEKTKSQTVYTSKNILYVCITGMAHFAFLTIFMSCLEFSLQAMIFASTGAFAPYFYLKYVGIFDMI